MNIQSLQKIGFTENEIKVYTTLLELGETTTGPIIKESQITGSKVYGILERLKKKGLVSQIIKEKTMYFQASSPERILDYVEIQEKQFEENKEEIKKTINSLKLKQNLSKTTQSAQVFEGWEGLKTVFKLIQNETANGKTYYAFALGSELEDEKTINFLRNHHQKRIEQKGKVKLLVKKEYKKNLQKWEKYKDLEIKFYNEELPTGVFIFSDYVANITFKHKTAFLIKSEHIAESYKKFFENIWKKTNKK